MGVRLYADPLHTTLGLTHEQHIRLWVLDGAPVEWATYCTDGGFAKCKSGEARSSLTFSTDRERCLLGGFFPNNPTVV